jgi:probable lipoprotein NlpC
VNRQLLYIICIAAFFSTSCRVKKHAANTHKSEKSELNALHIKKDLKKEIATWLGTPYKYGGVTRKGVDCSGLVNAIYSEVYELKLPRSSKDIYASCKKIKMKDLREGDLVFFNYTGKGVSHVGLYLGDGKYVHASTTKGVVISDVDNEYTKKRIVGAGRVK